MLTKKLLLLLHGCVCNIMVRRHRMLLLLRLQVGSWSRKSLMTGRPVHHQHHDYQQQPPHDPPLHHDHDDGHDHHHHHHDGEACSSSGGASSLLYWRLREEAGYEPLLVGVWTEAGLPPLQAGFKRAAAVTVRTGPDEHHHRTDERGGRSASPVEYGGLELDPLLPSALGGAVLGQVGGGGGGGYSVRVFEDLLAAMLQHEQEQQQHGTASSSSNQTSSSRQGGGDGGAAGRPPPPRHYYMQLAEQVRSSQPARERAGEGLRPAGSDRSGVGVGVGCGGRCCTAPPWSCRCPRT